MRWLSLSLLFAALILGGCGGGDNDDTPPDDPVMLLIEAADKIRAADTFRMEIIHSGAEHLIEVYLGDDTTVPVQVAFRRALAQYVAEEILAAQVSILLGSVPFNLDIYAQGYDQWFRLQGNPMWVHGEFAPGFNPKSLIADDTGFQAALVSLENLQYIGRESLDTGDNVYHISGTAEGGIVTALLVGLIEAYEDVIVDAYIHRDTGFPARLVIQMPETVSDEVTEPTTWTLDVYDVNAEPDLNKPEGE